MLITLDGVIVKGPQDFQASATKNLNIHLQFTKCMRPSSSSRRDTNARTGTGDGNSYWRYLSRPGIKSSTPCVRE